MPVTASLRYLLRHSPVGASMAVSTGTRVDCRHRRWVGGLCDARGQVHMHHESPCHTHADQPLDCTNLESPWLVRQCDMQVHPMRRSRVQRVGRLSLLLLQLSTIPLSIVPAWTPVNPAISFRHRQETQTHMLSTKQMMQSSDHESSDRRSSSDSSIIPPPPAISLPVWSLAASTASLGTRESLPPAYRTDPTSMNIVTYAIPVSVAAPKLWMVSLYHGTLTKDSLLSDGRGVLQLLAPRQKNLVVLGKQSGYSEHGEHKSTLCAAEGYPWTRQHGFQCDVSLLPHCVSYIGLEVVDTMEAGDHVGVLCQVVQTGYWDEEQACVALVSKEATVPALDAETVLYSGLLREEGLI